MNTTKKEHLEFPFHIFGNLWLQDPSIFLDETDQLEMMQRMNLIQEFDRSRKYCWFSPDISSSPVFMQAS